MKCFFCSEIFPVCCFHQLPSSTAQFYRQQVSLWICFLLLLRRAVFPVPYWQVHLRICSHYNNKTRFQEQHSHVGLMILQGHAFGISHRVSWKQEHNCVNALFFLMSNSSPSLSPRMEQDVVTRTGICLSAGCGMIQGWNNASPLR